MAIDIGRRQFTAVGGAVSAWPIAALAAGGRPRIGVLEIKSAESDARNLAAFRDGLQQFGYVESRTADIDYRYADGDTDALTVLAQELILLKPIVVLTDAVSPTRAIKRIAPDLPIVCVAFGDAFIPSLAATEPVRTCKTVRRDDTQIGVMFIDRDK
jgi:putative ABC transport system substrate-binding protein